MKTIVWSLILFGLVSSALAFGQVAGNRAGASPQQNPGQRDESGKRRLPANYGGAAAEQSVNEQPNLLVTTYQFIDARVLVSLPSKGYVAVFGLNQEADRLEEANRKLQDQISRLRQGLAALGVRPEDIYVDFITQTRTYDYQIKDNTARERLAGFQIKENLAVRYPDQALLDKIVPLAAQQGVYDLIRVEYQTEDLAPVRDRMAEEARKIIRKKEQNYAALGIKLTPVSVSAESFDAFQPSDAYSSYRAFETGGVDTDYRVIERRKSSTLYFDPLDPGRFDAVLTPIAFEPQAQCAYYLRVKYLVTSHTTVLVGPAEAPEN
ncbi:MAG TPA: SIMPL domain-containing protein [Terriglobia bacterium]|nr:SIMPL domain-containing protein [Terriglobia bacterium]